MQQVSKKKKHLLGAALAVLVVLSAVVAVLTLHWQQAVKQKPLAPEHLPDSGALALPVACAYSTELLEQGGVRLFADERELAEFTERYHLRDAARRTEVYGALALSEEFDFATQQIFFCYLPLSAAFALRDCYLEELSGGALRLRAATVITDEALRYDNQVLQGYLVAVEKSGFVITEPGQIQFLVKERRPGETTTADPDADFAALSLLEPVSVQSKTIRVRAELKAAAPKNWKLLGADYFTLMEYRGYEWQLTALKPGALPSDQRIEALSLREFEVSLEPFPPLESGRQYCLVLQLNVDDGSEEGRRVNVRMEFKIG
ncbi:MAG: hypothetical protein LBQ33_01310 [Oscillospiraceae bacterium]|jgi:hypothetical protein|nr:hypothetical protein [Oscillospiraceae bacterium]